MKTETRDLADLSLLEQNPRLHPERQLGEMVRSLEMFGQYRPLVIDPSGVILAGNGMYQAMQRAGWSQAEVLVMHHLSASERQKLILADNRLADLGSTDFSVIDDILRGMDQDFDIPGFDSSVLEDLMSTPADMAMQASTYGTVDPQALEEMRDRQVDLAEAQSRATVGSPPPPLGAPAQVMAPAEDAQRVEVTAENGQTVSACPTCGRAW